MTDPVTDLPDTAARPGRASKPVLLLTTFTAAIFLSAALLFAVQPMFTKLVLPRLGGSPSVWSVAMVFFQAALLVGYAYAHLLTRFAPGRKSIVIHLVVMLVACIALPLHIATGWGRPPAVGEAFWLLGLFAVSIGLPFFALAANSPLLQAWFARTDHPAAKDPYFLYAASNVGSFLALISYPAVIEPLVRLGDQTLFWSFGFGLLIALIGCCGVLLWRTADHAPWAATAESADAAPPTWRDAAGWIGLAAVPAGLLVAVTAHISTDVAAVPLLWVLPLALYLLTFVIVFQTKPIIPYRFVVLVQPVFIIGLIAVLVYDPLKDIVGLVAAHVTVFFVCALMCHGELAARRPAPRDLTAFYMWISAGGMIGGISAGLVAPYVFNWIAEYPILIALAVLCRPGPWLPVDRYERYILFVMLAAGLLGIYTLVSLDLDIDERTFNAVIGALLVATVLFWNARVTFAAIVAFVLAATHLYGDTGYIKTERSFFGVVKISDTSDGQFRVFTHGTTMHGAERLRDPYGNPVSGRPEVLLYYYDGSAIAQVIDAARMHKAGPISYAVVGLGTGSLACRSTSDDTVTYYEIDPAVISIARDPSLFTFISQCRPDVPIVLGDARLTLEDAPDGAYDAIVVDAFSSDAIPIHLLTREAMALYLKKLSPHGIIAMHISNRYLELTSVVAGTAAANGALARMNDGSDVVEDDSQYKFVGTVVAVARTDDDLGPLSHSQYWQLQQPDPKQWVWTDDYSNIVGAVIRQIKQE